MFGFERECDIDMSFKWARVHIQPWVRKEWPVAYPIGLLI